MYEAVIAYRPRAEGELRLQRGDKVSRSQDVGGGWVIAFNHRSGETGLVPMVCLTPRPSRVSRRLTRLVTRSHRQPHTDNLPHTGSLPQESTDHDVNKRMASSNRVPPQPIQSCNQISEAVQVTLDEEEDNHAHSPETQQDGMKEELTIAVPSFPFSPVEKKVTDGTNSSGKIQDSLKSSHTPSRQSSKCSKPQVLLRVPHTEELEMSSLDQQRAEDANDDSALKKPSSQECSVLMEPGDDATAEEALPSAGDAEMKQLHSSLRRGPAKKKTVRIVIPEKIPERGQRRSRRKTSNVGIEAERDLELGRESCCRLLLSMLMALVVMGILYGVLVWCFHVEHPNAVLTCAVTLFMTFLGQLMSRHCRALIVLTFPSLFTATGRAVMLAIITQMILAGPGANILHNSRAVAASVACVRDTAHNLTFGHADLCLDTTYLATAIQHGGHNLRKEMRRQLRDVKEKVNETLQECHANFMDGGPVQNSSKGSIMSTISERETDMAKLQGEDDVNMSGHGSSSSGTLWREKAGNLSDVIDNVTNQFDSVLGSVKVISENPHVKSSRQPQTIDDEGADDEHLTFEEVEEQLQDPINLSTMLAGYLRNLLILAVALPLIESYLYMRRYLSRYSFDNVFITPRLKEIDIERRRMGLHGVFPLRRGERERYVDQNSWKLSPMERSHIKSALVILIFHMLIYGMTLLVDFLLFFLLSLMTKQLRNEYSYPTVSYRMQTSQVSGTGFLGNVLEQILSSANGSSTANHTSAFQACMKEYKGVDQTTMCTTLVMYLATLLIIICHGYGCRIRQLILAFYYPLLHEARTQHLYHNIYIKRKSFVREARDMIQPCMAAGDEADGFLEKRAAGFGLFRALCPCLKESVYMCHNCKCYSSYMRRCNKDGCSTILCRNCLVDSSGLCPNCIQDVEEESEECLSDNPKKGLIS